MLNSLVKGISKIFGDKSQRDIKQLKPIVDEVNRHFEQYKSLSNDQLRAKTADFKNRIAEYLKDIDAELDELKTRAENPEISIDETQEVYGAIDKLKKKRDEELEKVLKEIMPEAFAVVKETSRRFTENTELVATATDFDRELSTRKNNVRIDGDKAIYSNTWDAAGTPVTWNMVHYDVQLIGGANLHNGKISEMATGEGKTLVSTLPAYLNGLSGQGVHIVTVNDYLARRDCEWNAPLFEFHGLRVDCLDYHQPNSPGRRNAYLADITYGTNNEFGFDYLRDNMAHEPEDLVQGKHHFAMVDEVDSVLVDDARTPLIISGPVPKGDQQEFIYLKPRIEKLVEAQRRYVNTALADAKKLIAEGKEKEGGLLLMRAQRGMPKNKALVKFLGEPGMKQFLTKTENYYLQDQQKEMPKVDAELYFVIEEKQNSVDLTEKGIEMITTGGEEKDFFIMPDVGSEIAEIERTTTDPEEKIRKKEELMRDYSIKSERIHSINQLLKAYCMFERDVEYIIDNGKIKIVDEQTGRVLDGRRYSDGLHQAIEAKENVKVEAATQTFATITLQNYFRMYHKLAGMTGTAETEAGEFWEIYKLDVVVIPTNRSIIRKDYDDLIYKTKREKYNAVIDEIVKLTGEGRPVLVGTTSVEVSELLSKMLTLRKIKHNVLNAKQHQREADIVAEAGFAGTVTIATNMAGRGTDIKLGPGVKEAGGLAIIGTERHESRRVDRQLRGRAGRQGDPGTSQFFISLEDDLMRLFASHRIANVMDRFGHKEGDNIQHSLISRSIESAQKKVEQNNFGIRKRLLEYDDVMNSQREVIYTRRRNALFGDKLKLDINNMLFDAAQDIVGGFHAEGDYEGMKLEFIRLFAHDTEITQKEFSESKPDKLIDKAFHELSELYDRKSKQFIEFSWPVIKEVYETRGQSVENIVVPITDGIKSIQILVNLKKAYESKGREMVTSFEKMTTLATIDEEWKEHLREMDDLKQSAQNAVFEQKDPLLIYKLESFDLFRNMVARLSKDILTVLFKGRIATQEADNVRNAAPRRREDTSRLQTRRPQEVAATGTGGPVPPQQEERIPQQPMKAEVKVGRNDPCPCGSGKKFKNCHGAEL
ncbi:MAG TPA: preprotein translocase subunit SecA [Bacteroidia bacterium]|nr:preprotein translocase subunit SecA [Bacteroidia bacterium]